MGAGLLAEGTATGECDSCCTSTAFGKGEGTQPEEPEPFPWSIPGGLMHCSKKGEVVVPLASSSTATHCWHQLC